MKKLELHLNTAVKGLQLLDDNLGDEEANGSYEIEDSNVIVIHNELIEDEILELFEVFDIDFNIL